MEIDLVEHDSSSRCSNSKGVIEGLTTFQEQHCVVLSVVDTYCRVHQAAVGSQVDCGEEVGIT